MKLHRNAALSWSGRRRLVERVLEEGWTLSAAAEAAGVSVRCTRKWVGRYRLEGELGLRDRSSAPRRVANRTAPERVEVILALRRLLLDVSRQSEVDEIATEQVDGDREVDAFLTPCPRLRKRRVQDVPRQRPHERRRLDERDQVVGRQQTELGVLPANERFDDLDLARREIRLRLVVEDELAASHRAAKLADERDPLRRVAVGPRRVHLGAVRLLADVHGDVRVADERLGSRRAGARRPASRRLSLYRGAHVTNCYTFRRSRK